MSRLHRLTVVIAGAVLALVGIAPSGASAAVPDPFKVGYVWNDLPSQAGCHNPASYWSYNSTTAANEICRVGTGQWEVRFPGLAASGGNAQVTAYGSAPASCKVVWWLPSGSAEVVRVHCFTFAGAPTDAHFTASFAAGGGAANTIAFAWAHDPTAASYTPSPTYQYNNRGGLATVTHGSIPGSYSVSLPDSFGASSAGGVKVTSYGWSTDVCKVVSWGPTATAEVVNVQCYDTAGNPADEQFSLVYVNGMNILGDNLLADGYAWANEPSSGSYTPALAYQRNTALGTLPSITITSPLIGTYDVFLPGQDKGLDGGHFQVTAYGSGSARCQVGYWNPTAGGRTARIYCFTNTGILTDTLFDVQYTGKVQ